MGWATLLGQPTRLDGRGLRGGHGEGPLGADHLGEVARLGQTVPGRNHVVDQSPAQGFLGVELPAGQQHLHGDGVGELALQAHGGAGRRDQSPARLGQGEGGVLLADPDVGLLQHFATATEAGPVDGRDERRAQPVGEQQGLSDPTGLLDHLAFGVGRRHVAGGHPARGQVASGAVVPGSGAGEDDAEDVRVTVHEFPRRRQPPDHVEGQGIPPLRAIHGQGDDRAVAIQDQAGSGPGSAHSGPMAPSAARAANSVSRQPRRSWRTATVCCPSVGAGAR